MSMIYYYRKKIFENILKVDASLVKEISEDKPDMMRLQDFLDSKRRCRYYTAEEVMLDFWLNQNNKRNKDYLDSRRFIRLAGLDPDKYAALLEKYKLK